MWQSGVIYIISFLSVKPFYEVDTLTIFILKMKEPKHRHLRETFKVCDCRSWLKIITGEPFLVFDFLSTAIFNSPPSGGKEVLLQLQSFFYFKTGTDQTRKLFNHSVVKYPVTMSNHVTISTCFTRKLGNRLHNYHCSSAYKVNT